MLWLLNRKCLSTHKNYTIPKRSSCRSKPSISLSTHKNYTIPKHLRHDDGLTACLSTHKNYTIPKLN